MLQIYVENVKTNLFWLNPMLSKGVFLFFFWRRRTPERPLGNLTFPAPLLALLRINRRFNLRKLAMQLMEKFWIFRVKFTRLPHLKRM